MSLPNQRSSFSPSVVAARISSTASAVRMNSVVSAVRPGVTNSISARWSHTV
jgi:hypothetical protein